ncbi:MAG: DUF2279 domain-containing protein [Bacteroidia bacterium]|nr:DUF2279 domain-containing protein [Bacteroidia bacterium]
MPKALSGFLIIFISIVVAGKTFSQTDSIKPQTLKNRKIILASTSGFLTCGSLVALNQAWYKDYNTGSFHFFNDDTEWLQMDKVGHFYTNYQMADLMMNAFDWAGYSKKQKLFIGGGIGFTYMTAIECMDGFSRGWGFSWSDELANVLGTSLAIGQEAFWQDQKIRLKFSYAESGLAKYNPSLLGKNQYTRLLKDYNGQTYWLSFHPMLFTKRKTAFPAWLNVALGYSAYGMLGGHANLVLAVDENGNVLKFTRERRFYLSVDVDLTKIKTRSKVLKKVFTAFNMLKFPAPALQLGGGKLRFYGIYY